MKDKVYYPGPKPLPHNHGGDVFVDIGTIAECEEAMLRPKAVPKEATLTYNPTAKWPAPPLGRSDPICVCVTAGLDGTATCSPKPHRHRLQWRRNATALTVSCDNHLHNYMGLGWIKVMRACARCTTNTPRQGDDICELCAFELGESGKVKNDATRLKASEVGYCLNRDQGVQGCLAYSLPGEQLCAFCKGYAEKSDLKSKTTAKAVIKAGTPMNPKIRTVPTSSRPCAITVGCAGTMEATVRRYNSEQPPELWWYCPVCHVNKVAPKTRAVVAAPTELEQEAIAAMMNEGSPADPNSQEAPGDLSGDFGGVEGMVRAMLDGGDE